MGALWGALMVVFGVVFMGWLSGWDGKEMAWMAVLMACGVSFADSRM
jgi:hypothetical protein